MSRTKAKAKANEATAPLRTDGYYNAITKFGTARDSTEYYRWQPGEYADDTQLADMYAGNGLFATIIDAPASDAVKNGMDLGIKDKALQKKIDEKLQKLTYQSKFAKAIKWARLFGGSVAVMLVDDGRLLQDPLNWRDVRGVEELLVYGRNEVSPLWVSGYENNPTRDNYRRGGTGVPTYYQVSSVYGSYIVHSSRCLVFHGSDIPENATSANIYRTWGIPEYMRIRTELRDASIGTGYSIRLLERLCTLSYKMKGLARLMETDEGEDTILHRMELIDMGRNLLNMIAVDADTEDLAVQSLTVSGVKDILDNACTMLSAVSHIPQTRLFGRSPAGMNATGDGDLENYKEFIGQIQSGDLLDNTRTLVELVMRGMLWAGEIAEIPEYTVTYNSAWSLSDDEKAAQEQTKAATQLTKAQTVVTYATNGILDPPEIRRALAGDEPFDPENLLTAEDLQQEQDWGLNEKDNPQEQQPAGNGIYHDALDTQRRFDAEFDESEHDRDKEGKFSEMDSSADKSAEGEDKDKAEGQEAEAQNTKQPQNTETAQAQNQLTENAEADKVRAEYIEANTTAVTMESIQNVKPFKSTVLTPEASSRIANAEKKLLFDVASKPKGTEASRTFSMDGTPLTDVQYGEDGGLRVPIASHDVDYVAVHNHPDGKTFSSEDIAKFIGNSHMRVLTAVGNDGHVYAVEKTSTMNPRKLTAALNETKAKLDNAGTLQEAHDIMENFLKGAASYGIAYHS